MYTLIKNDLQVLMGEQPNYIDVISALWCLEPPLTRFLVQQSGQADLSQNSKPLHYWPFVDESTGSRCIPLTKGQ